MRIRLASAFVIALFTLCLVASPAAAGDRAVREFTQEFDVNGADTLYLDVSVGEIHIEGTDSDRIVAEVRVRCDGGWNSSRCEERADDVEIEQSTRRGTLMLEVAGVSTWRSGGMSVELHLSMPADLDMELDFGVGEAGIRDLRGDVHVDMGIGEVSVRLPQASVGKVRVGTTIGEASLRRRDGRRSQASGLFAGGVRWSNGPGSSEVVVELNIGEATVTLN